MRQGCSPPKRSAAGGSTAVENVGIMVVDGFFIQTPSPGSTTARIPLPNTHSAGLFASCFLESRPPNPAVLDDEDMWSPLRVAWVDEAGRSEVSEPLRTQVRTKRSISLFLDRLNA